MTELPASLEPALPLPPEPLLVSGDPVALPLPTAGAIGEPRKGRLSVWPAAKWARRVALIAAVGALLLFALRNAPLREIWSSLRGLQPSQIALLLAVDLLIYGLIAARWWFVAHSQDRRVAYLPLLAVRLAVFGVSYFTLGPQVGGEPLQVFYLQRKYGLSYTRGAASVLMDKLFEVLANFLLLSFGLVALLHSGLLAGAGSLAYVSIAVLAGLAAWPFMHIALLYRRIYPLSAFARALLPGIGQTRAVRFVRASEHLAGRFCRQQPRAMLSAVLVSLLAAAATVGEYALITSFLHLGLPFWQTITAWTAGWLSFLVPLPGGLGALEASQVYALGFFGISPASAISVTLVLRGRDFLIGGLGLLLAGKTAHHL
ncbi:MAG: lysylphosphatidylglycerol synthase transmembrane domain-containing protein [Anaerolineales bacterium]